MNNFRQANAARDAQIVELYRAGQNAVSIGKVVRLSGATVGEILRRLVPHDEFRSLRSKYIRKAQRAAYAARHPERATDDESILRLRREMMSMADIAAKLGYRSGTIRERLAKLMPEDERRAIEARIESHRIDKARSGAAMDPVGEEYELRKRQVREAGMAAMGAGTSVRQPIVYRVGRAG